MRVKDIIKKLQKLEKDLGNVNVLAHNQDGEFEELDAGFISGDDPEEIGEKNIYIGIFSTKW